MHLIRLNKTILLYYVTAVSGFVFIFLRWNILDRFIPGVDAIFGHLSNVMFCLFSYLGLLVFAQVYYRDIRRLHESLEQEYGDFPALFYWSQWAYALPLLAAHMISIFTASRVAELYLFNHSLAAPGCMLGIYFMRLLRGSAWVDQIGIGLILISLLVLYRSMPFLI